MHIPADGEHLCYTVLSMCRRIHRNLVGWPGLLVGRGDSLE